MKKIIRLTESDLRRIVKNSLKRILKEDKKAPDMQNVVSQKLAERFGFQMLYATNDGLEIWEKTGVDKRMFQRLLAKLNIDRYTYWSSSMNGYRVGITVQGMPRGGGRRGMQSPNGQSPMNNKWQ